MQNPKCHRPLVSDNRNCSTVLRTPQTISVVIEWHVSSRATFNSSRKGERKKKQKKTLSCRVLACLFYGLIFVGHSAEGMLQRKEFLTIWQGRLSGDTCYWNRDMFIWFKDSSGHLLCHWKWSLALLFELTVCLIQIWQVVAWQEGAGFNHQDGAVKSAKCTDLTNQDVRHIVSVTFFKALIVALQEQGPLPFRPRSRFATNETLRIQRTSWNLSGGGVNHRLHPQHYTHSRGLLQRNIPAVCQPVDK